MADRYNVVLSLLGIAVPIELGQCRWVRISSHFGFDMDFFQNSEISYSEQKELEVSKNFSVGERELNNSSIPNQVQRAISIRGQNRRQHQLLDYYSYHP